MKKPTDEAKVQALDKLERILADEDPHTIFLQDHHLEPELPLPALSAEAFNLCSRTLARLAGDGKVTVNADEMRQAMTVESYSGDHPAARELAWDYLTRVYLNRVATPATASGD